MNKNVCLVLLIIGVARIACGADVPESALTRYLQTREKTAAALKRTRCMGSRNNWPKVVSASHFFACFKRLFKKPESV